MKKKFTVRFLAAVMIALMVLPYGGLLLDRTMPVYGDTSADLDDAKGKKEELNNKIEDINKEIDDLKNQSKSTQEYIQELDAQMAELDGSLYTLNNQIDELNMQIQEAEVNLVKAQEDAEEQYDMMKLRIKFMYEHNDESYLAILLSSRSMGELLNRAEYISKISSYDRDMLTQYQETVNYIAQTKIQLESDYASLDNMKVSLESRQNSLRALQAAKKQEMDNLEKQVAKSKEEQNGLYADLGTIEDDIKKIEEQQRREEQENAHINGGDGNANSSGGAFLWPTVSRRITSDYGDMEDRTSPHKGLDIGAVTPGVWGDPIYAAQGGTVVISTYSQSAGYYIMINHGNGLYSVYMHCSKLYVSVGDTVTKGQTISLMGSTGNSTGAHLHFGVRLNGVYVNPRPYVGI